MLLTFCSVFERKNMLFSAVASRYRGAFPSRSGNKAQNRTLNKEPHPSIKPLWWEEPTSFLSSFLSFFHPFISFLAEAFASLYEGSIPLLQSFQLPLHLGVMEREILFFVLKGSYFSRVKNCPLAFKRGLMGMRERWPLPSI